MSALRHSLTTLRLIVSILALSAIVVALFLTVINAFPWSVAWDPWSILTAIGTIGATFVAVGLAFRGWRQEKDATARLVAAWVTDKFEPRSDGSSYRRTTHVHIANEANEPVFSAKLNVHIGRGQTSIGPLGAPSVISVVPPRRELVFDISTPLLAHGDSWDPTVTLTFNDPKGRRWLRQSDGVLRDVSGKKSRWSKQIKDIDEQQLGDTQSLFNPMMFALAFLAGLRDPKTPSSELAVLLSPGAGGWADVDWDQLRHELENYQPTTMVDYPVPRIARIKLSGDKNLEGRQVEGDGTGLELSDYMFMTLTLDPQLGWRVFSVGGSIPLDAINFGGSLIQEINPYDGTIPANDGQEK